MPRISPNDAFFLESSFSERKLVNRYSRSSRQIERAPSTATGRRGGGSTCYRGAHGTCNETNVRYARTHTYGMCEGNERERD